MFLPVKSVGVTGDGRRYDYVVALRAVETIDFMTARWAHLPYDFLENCSRRIINEVRASPASSTTSPASRRPRLSGNEFVILNRQGAKITKKTKLNRQGAKNAKIIYLFAMFLAALASWRFPIFPWRLGGSAILIQPVSVYV